MKQFLIDSSIMLVLAFPIAYAFLGFGGLL